MVYQRNVIQILMRKSLCYTFLEYNFVFFFFILSFLVQENSSYNIERLNK